MKTTLPLVSYLQPYFYTGDACPLPCNETSDTIISKAGTIDDPNQTQHTASSAMMVTVFSIRVWIHLYSILLPSTAMTHVRLYRCIFTEHELQDKMHAPAMVHPSTLYSKLTYSRQCPSTVDANLVSSHPRCSGCQLALQLQISKVQLGTIAVKYCKFSLNCNFI